MFEEVAMLDPKHADKPATGHSQLEEANDGDPFVTPTKASKDDTAALLTEDQSHLPQVTMTQPTTRTNHPPTKSTTQQAIPWRRHQ